MQELRATHAQRCSTIQKGYLQASTSYTQVQAMIVGFQAAAGRATACFAWPLTLHQHTYKEPTQRCVMLWCQQHTGKMKPGCIWRQELKLAAHMRVAASRSTKSTNTPTTVCGYAATNAQPLPCKQETLQTRETYSHHAGLLSEAQQHFQQQMNLAQPTRTCIHQIAALWKNTMLPYQGSTPAWCACEAPMPPLPPCTGR